MRTKGVRDSQLRNPLVGRVCRVYRQIPLVPDPFHHHIEVTMELRGLAQQKLFEPVEPPVDGTIGR